MDNKKDSSRRPSEGRNHSSSILYIFLAGMALFMVIMYLFQQPHMSIKYSDLEDLIEEYEVDEDGNATGSWTITVSKDKKLQLSNLTDLTISMNSVSGKINVKDLSADPPKEESKGVTFKTALVPGPDAASDMKKLLEKHGISDFAGPGEKSFIDQFGMFFVVTALLIFLFYMMMRRLGGTGSAVAFGKSRGKLQVQEDLNISFDDVAGIEEAVEEVKEVVDFLRNPGKYEELGGRIPKGVLLVGPPGTGKTLLAKAIAGEADVSFFSMSGSDFVEMFVGVGASRVRDMFQQAAAKSPCIIFIDELDALGKSRGNGMMGGNDEREQTLNALLVEMDGFDSNAGIIVVAATNRPEMLDSALLRPGRFDRQVLVDRPDAAGRVDILAVHVQTVKLDETVDIKKVASITAGFAGADLANLVNEAALLAARKGLKAVSMLEFDEAVERVTAGLEKKQRVMQDDEKQRVAYHESGHALVTYCLPNTDPVHKVSIIPRGMAALGYVMSRPTEDRFLKTQGELESNIQIALAGTLAEEIIYDEISTGAQNDLERATAMARAMVTDYGMSRLGRVNYRSSGRSAFLPDGSEERSGVHSEQTSREIDIEVKRIIDELLEKTRRLLEDRKDTLLALSARLLELEVIDSEELKRVMEANTDGPRIVPGTDVQKRSSVRDSDSTESEETGNSSESAS
ncbi:MAG: cell division protein FtsH [Blastopirellula sp.]|nr:MAG: cell division protein FtsH [Blastopirellula sp.]